MTEQERLDIQRILDESQQVLLDAREIQLQTRAEIRLAQQAIKQADAVLNGRIVDIISAVTPLTETSSGNYLGLCPFHAEKTPSFCVSTKESMFHCFGCGAGGNAAEFLRRIRDKDKSHEA